MSTVKCKYCGESIDKELAFKEEYLTKSMTVRNRYFCNEDECDKYHKQQEEKELKEKMDELSFDLSYAQRYVNEGFSGGERKKNEILQMSILNPKLAILDETDSGLDVDAVRIVSEGVQRFHNEENAVLIITHHNQILQKLKPDYVHVLINGKIVKTGDASLVREIEEKGYDAYKALA